MKRVDQTELLLKAGTGRLSPEEQAMFDQLVFSDPAFREAWNEEKALQERLSSLPDAPISSNFTSLVLQAVRQEERRAAKPPKRFARFGWSWPERVAVLGTVCVALVLGGLQYQNHKRTEMAESLSTISEVATVLTRTEENPGEATALLQDFDAIAHLSKVPEEQELDIELLVALQR